MGPSVTWSFPKGWTSRERSLSTQAKGETRSSFPWNLLAYPQLDAHFKASLVSLRRYLFWTEWGQYPRIERSRLDGSQRLVLVNVSISWPNGISIDYEVS